MSRFSLLLRVEMMFVHLIILQVIFYEKKNVGFSYKFVEPLPNSIYQPRYHWEHAEWGDCTARCGTGTQIEEADCLEELAGKVSKSFCDVNEKPEVKSRKCNEFPCPNRYENYK